MPEPELDFPAFIDSTMRGSFKACPQKWYWEWLRRLTLVEKSPDLIAGGAFAKGIEVVRHAFYGEGKSSDQAIYEGVIALIEFFGDYDPPESNPKTCARMVGALDEYFQVYPLETDYIKPVMLESGPAVEITFAIPLEIKHPQTGDPILYEGRFDMIGLHQEYQLKYVVDEKTTKQLGPTWADKWTMRGQFLGYMWGSKHYGIEVNGALIRGISILKKSYGHAEAIVTLQEWMLDQYIEQVHRDAQRMVEHWESNIFDKAFDEACNAYGGCGMKKLCMSPKPELWVTQLYRRNNWNPLKKNPEEE